eukprot:GCRY01002109.1.p1 GENE.GCRY01002109.1~~GCRY01002109.1.p1  ORF type:complete len:1026 (-),score=327.28 GCRY01002109.1:962-3979(-)
MEEQILNAVRVGFNNPASLKQVEDLFKEIPQHQGGFSSLLSLLTQDIECPVKQFIATQFKNLLKRVKEPLEGIPTIQTQLINVMSQTEYAVSKILAVSFSWLMIKHNNNEVIEHVIANISPDKGVEHLSGALLCLQMYTKAQALSSGEDNTFEQIAQRTVPTIIGIMQSAASQLTPETAMLQVISLKILREMIILKLPAVLINEELAVNLLQMVFDILRHPCESVTEENEQVSKHPYWKAKKWACRVLTQIFLRQLAKKGKPHNLPDYFRKHFALPVLEYELTVLRQHVTSPCLSKKVVFFILNFVERAIEIKSTYNVLMPNLPEIIEHIILPLASFTTAEQEMWVDDPVEFIRGKLEYGMDFGDPADAAVNIVGTLLRKKANDVAGPLLQFLTAFIQKETNEESVRRMQEGALRILGACFPEMPQSLIPTLVGFIPAVLGFLQSPLPYLRARAVTFLRRYNSLDEALLPEQQKVILLEAVVPLIMDGELPVRVHAFITFSEFAKNDIVSPGLKSHVPDIIQQLFKTMEEIDNEELGEVLDSLVQSYPVEMVPFAVTLIEKLTGMFRSQCSAAEGCDDAFFAASQTLTNILAMMDAVDDIPSSHPAIVQLLFPFVMEELDKAGFHFQDICQLASGVVEFTGKLQPVPQEIWHLWNKTMEITTKNLEDFVQDTFPIFVSFISDCGDTFIANEAAVQATLGLCHSFFAFKHDADDPKYPTSYPYANYGALLAMIILEEFPGRVDGLLEHFVKICGEVLFSTAPAFPRNSVAAATLVLYDAIYYNPILTLTLMQNMNFPLPAFFEKTFSDEIFEQFNMHYMLKVISVGISQLMRLSPSNVPQELHPVFGALFKHSFDLQKKSIEAWKKEKEEENDDDDDDSFFFKGDGGKFDDDDDDDDYDDDEGGDIDQADIIARFNKHLAQIDDESLSLPVMFSTKLDEVDDLIFFAESISQNGQFISSLVGDFSSALPMLQKEVDERKKDLAEIEKEIETNKQEREKALQEKNLM